MELSGSNIKKFLIFCFISGNGNSYHQLCCFLSGTSFLCCCTVSAMDLRELFLLSGIFYLTLLPHVCHSTASAMDLRELFLLSGSFYLTLLPDIWNNLLLSRLPWEPAVLPWRLLDLPLRLQTQTQLICLFESHSVQQKVLVGRLYLFVKPLWNTISTSSRVWTHYLIAICIVKCMSYSLGHQSS